MAYAEGTEVSVEKSRAEIESLLSRYGASEFMSGWNDVRSVIQFKASARFVRFELPIPDRNEKRFKLDGRGFLRNEAATSKAFEAEKRRRWRALALVIKAKLEAVQSGIATFEHEFLAHIVMPGGLTIGEMVTPAISEAYTTGRMLPLLPSGPEE